MRRALLAALAALTVLTACTDSKPGASVTPEDQLRSRPTFQQASQDYIALLTEVTKAVTAISPTVTWPAAPPRQDGGSLCAKPFTDIAGAHSATFSFEEANGRRALVKAIPDADWPRVKTTFVDIAKRHGFTTVTMDVDQPGRHEMTIADQYGATVEFGTIEGTSIGVFGACFLDAAKHQTS